MEILMNPLIRLTISSVLCKVKILMGQQVIKLPNTTGGRGPRGPQNPRAKQPKGMLEEFGINITESARRGEIDPVIGRDEEIKRVIEILNRRTKNNPVLIGEPGVGKTAVVEGLAQK